MELSKIVKFLNKTLKNNKIVDDSKNGLQVRSEKEVKKIGFAVDACMDVFEKAKQKKCDLVIVHHGLLWKDQKRKEMLKKRIGYLKNNGLSLYGSHLLLDVHPEYGNNIRLARLLGLEKIKKFGDYRSFTLGYSGVFKQSIRFDKLIKDINKKLGTKCGVMPFGKKKIKSLAIISGSGSAGLEEAIKKKFDAFLIGEGKHSNFHVAKEGKINLIFGGHYATETLGVKALAELLKEKFKIETVFINNPTGL